MLDKLKDIEEAVDKEELVLQLAEECSELSHACLKIVRAAKGQAYKPYSECIKNLAEEIADVELCIKTIYDTMPDIWYMKLGFKDSKIERWHKRLFGDDGGIK